MNALIAPHCMRHMQDASSVAILTPVFSIEPDQCWFFHCPVKMSLLCDWIAAVGEDGAEKVLLVKVLVFFAKRDIAKVSALASLSQADLESAEGWATDLETTSFLRRCHQMAAKASAVKAQHPSVTDQNAGLSSQAVQETAQHLCITGNEIYAQAIMSSATLGKGKPGRYLALAQPDNALFVVLEAEKRATRAAVLPCHPYFFVGLRICSIKHGERSGPGTASGRSIEQWISVFLGTLGDGSV